MRPVIRRSVTITTVESWILVWVSDEDPVEDPHHDSLDDLSVAETDDPAQEVTEVTSDVSLALSMFTQSISTPEDEREIKNLEAINDGQCSDCVDEPGPCADSDGAEQRTAD